VREGGGDTGPESKEGLPSRVEGWGKEQTMGKSIKQVWGYRTYSCEELRISAAGSHDDRARGTPAGIQAPKIGERVWCPG
jgi:hypothetical protein